MKLQTILVRMFPCHPVYSGRPKPKESDLITVYGLSTGRLSYEYSYLLMILVGVIESSSWYFLRGLLNSFKTRGYFFTAIVFHLFFLGQSNFPVKTVYGMHVLYIKYALFSSDLARCCIFSPWRFSVYRYLFHFYACLSVSFCQSCWSLE